MQILRYFKCVTKQKLFLTSICMKIFLCIYIYIKRLMAWWHDLTTRQSINLVSMSVSCIVFSSNIWGLQMKSSSWLNLAISTVFVQVFMNEQCHIPKTTTQVRPEANFAHDFNHPLMQSDQFSRSLQVLAASVVHLNMERANKKVLTRCYAPKLLSSFTASGLHQARPKQEHHDDQRSTNLSPYDLSD